MIKKRNCYTINLTNQAVACLQRLGFLNKNKHVNKSQNLSFFISLLITEHIGKNPKEDKFVREQLLKNKIFELSIERDRVQDQMELLATKLRSIKDIDKFINPTSGEENV